MYVGRQGGDEERRVGGREGIKQWAMFLGE